MRNMRRLAIAAAVVTIAVIGLPDIAHAATAGGTMPWDQPLTVLKDDLTGPVPFLVGLCGLVAGGFALVWGDELTGFTRRMIMLVIVVSFICAVVPAAQALGIVQGAVI